MRRAASLVATGALLASGLTAGNVITASSPAAAAESAPTAAASPAKAAGGLAVLANAPGNPGQPGDPSVIFEEDFENVPDPDPIFRLDEYVGETGQQYQADEAWLTLCDGWISSFSQPVDSAEQVEDCNRQQTWNAVQRFAYALGMLNDDAAPEQNHSVSALTAGNPGAGLVEFETATNVPFTAEDRFVTFGVDIAVEACTSAHPLLQFSLLEDDGTDVPVGDEIDACELQDVVSPPELGDAPATPVQVGRFASNGSILFNGSSIGVRLVNNQGSGIGNDHAFDNIRILDVTPQLDKSFSPASVPVGETSTLTLTVTNTSELAQKDGWGFTDELPDGLVVADEPNLGGDCVADITADVGADAVTVADGSLPDGTESCTITVDVTSDTVGEYTNGADNITGEVGIDLPGDSTVEFYASDFGDAPATYGTTLAEDGARHGLPGLDADDGIAPIMLGDAVTADEDGQPAEASDSDAGDDGVAFNPELGYPTPTLRTGIDPNSFDAVENTLTVDASADGFVSVWVDWDLDGEFSDAEKVVASQAVSAGDNDVTFSQGENPDGIRTHVRVRYSTDADAIAAPTGAAPDGEVEDYRVLVERLVLPDACTVSDVEYSSFTFDHVTARSGSGEPGSSVRYENAAVVHGVPVDMVAELLAGQLTSSATRPNGFSGTSVDTGSVLGPQSAAWYLNQTATIQYSFYEAGTTTPIAINGVFTVNDLDGAPATQESMRFEAADLAGYALTQGSAVEIVESDPYVTFNGNGDNNGEAVSRFQVVLEDMESFVAVSTGGTETGLAFNGNGALAIEPPACDDFGDAPDTYGTTLASDGPRHRVTPDLTLGTEIDFDTDGQPSDDASGDDSNRIADEDGVAGPIEIVPGVPATVSVSATNDAEEPATLAGWIDLDGDGTFESDERVTLAVPAGSGTQSYELTFPGATMTRDTFARFRLFPGEVEDPAPTGAAAGGEVEDYVVTSADLPVPAVCTPEEIRATERWWYFGENGGIDFGVSGETAEAFVGNQTTQEGSTVVTDSKGVLQFWSNGQQVFDRNGDPMPNGADLLGNPSATQTVAAFPALGQPGRFYVVTTSTDVGQAANGSLSYSVVDMSLNGGLGDVTADKNLPLGPAGTASEAITAVPNADGSGFWVLTYTNSSPNVLAYEFDADGPVSGEPVTSVMPSSNFDGYGSLAFSADYTQLVAMSSQFTNSTTGTTPGVIRLLDFNAETGQVFERYEWATNDQPGSGRMGYNAEFSPDGRFVYATKIFDGAQLYRYDLQGATSGADVVATEENLGSIGAFGGQIRRGPDGNMYVANLNGNALSVVADPNNPDDPELVTGGFPLPVGAISRFGLPQTVTGCPPPTGQLVIEKESDATADTRVGDTVTYTVTATNTGEGDYTAEDPAVVLDDLSGVLDDGDYNNDAVAEIGGDAVATPALVGDMLSWSGPLPAGESVVITYTVTLTAGGDGEVRNVAFVADCDPADPDCEPTPPPTDCAEDDPTCDETETVLPRLEIQKTADTTELPAVGEDVEYTITVTNVGPGDYTEQAPASFTDDLTEVLDDAIYGDDAEASSGTLDYTEPELSWEGVLAANESATITYTVEYTAEGDLQLQNTVCIPETEVAPGAAPCDRVIVPGGEVISWKQVSPSDTPAAAGSVLTYTLFFKGRGEIPSVVDAIDDLTHVLDDADVTVEPTSDSDDLTVTRDAERISITGSVEPGETATVSYQVTLREDGERGDDIAANFLLGPDDTPPPTPECEPTDEQLPDCTVTPVGELITGKSVEADTDPVDTGTELTYTLTFENVGEAPVDVDRIDRLADVLDDATLADAPVASDDALTVSGVIDDQFSIRGSLEPDQLVTVTYSVIVNAEDERGNDIAANFLVRPGDDEIEECVPEEGELPNCTVTRLPHIVPAKSADPESGTALKAGQEVTYTLTFTNDGEAAGPVNYTDDLSAVLDDADLTVAPQTSGPELSATSGANGRVDVTGSLEPDATATVSYTVTVRPDGERGDNWLRNVLAKPGSDGDCDDADTACTEHPVGELDDWKTVDPASGSAVQPGQVLTYTLHFENIGEARVDVDREDVLTQVLDDAALTSAPVSSDEALTVSDVEDGRFAITGSLEPDELVTVTYTVTVNEDDARGDDLLGNFLVDPDEDGGPCEPADDERPDCTVNHVSSVVASKSADPASGTEVGEGRAVTYTLTFENVSKNAQAAPAPLDYTDHMADVLDDATVTAEPEASDDSIAAVRDGETIRVTGSLAAGETATVTYTVTVDDWADQGNHHLGNVVAVTGDDPICAPDSPLCTEHPLVENPPLAITGGEIAWTAVWAALVLLLGGGALLVIRRRQAPDRVDHDSAN